MLKRSAILASTAAAAAFGFMGLTATPAQAIDNVTCRDGAGYTEIFNEKRHCFANAGRADVWITNVYEIRANNNNITIWYRYGTGGIAQTQLNKNQNWTNINPRITVEDIQIH
ncbi:beta/gamma crystallin domain-containing protein [Nonomuraea sp. NPDC050783]|uniref:beta/gamma crystallin domain-containing protein n=1 Tax=Nonomuraea sp. NPDC050783 TaxID=3154634 RepID=UPI0034672275